MVSDNTFFMIFAVFDVLLIAVLKVLSVIFTVADRGDLSMLTLLDLSVAFDTVNHPILLSRLMTFHGVNSVVYTWISLYLSNRLSTSAVLDPDRLHPRCCVQSHRSRSWGRCSFFYVQRILYSW